MTYNVLSLVDYLLCSGVFQDPVSRVVFTESNLKQLDAQTKAAGLAAGRQHSTHASLFHG